jgi:CopG-like RHH_1 or ribbon-helix-helix domain, RHH_5
MQQINVHLPDDLLSFVRREAARGTRTMSRQVHHFIAEAARRAGNGTAGLEPWPPPLEPVTRENLSDIKTKVREMQVERDKLVAAEQKSRTGLMPHDQDRLQFLRGRIEALSSHIVAIERLAS